MTKRLPSTFHFPTDFISLLPPRNSDMYLSFAISLYFGGTGGRTPSKVSREGSSKPNPNPKPNIPTWSTVVLTRGKFSCIQISLSPNCSTNYNSKRVVTRSRIPFFSYDRYNTLHGTYIWTWRHRNINELSNVQGRLHLLSTPPSRSLTSSPPIEQAGPCQHLSSCLEPVYLLDAVPR